MTRIEDWVRQVDIAALVLDATTGAPLVVLREQDAPHRVVPILVGGTEAAAIALALSGETPPRPLPYDLMAALVESLDGRVERVEVTELRDGAFLAELALTGPGGGRRLDTRPSDGIALALRLHAPLFVREAVLEEAGTVLPVVQEAPGADPAAIDDQVAAFASSLADVLPADFVFDPDAETGPDTPDPPAG